MNRTAVAAAAFAFAAGAALATEIARPDAVTTPVVRTAKTAIGQPIETPAHPELIVALTTIPVHGATRVHKHPWQRCVYVLAGQLRVTDMATGEARDYRPGDFIAEMRGAYHFGANTGADPVKLLVIDAVPPGTTSNVVMQTDEH